MQFCRVYLLVPAFTLTSALLLWRAGPQTQINPPDQDTTSDSTSNPPQQSNKSASIDSEDVQTFKQIVLSRQFVYLAAFASVHILRLNFFVSNINGMTEELSDQATELQSVFNMVC